MKNQRIKDVFAETDSSIFTKLEGYELNRTEECTNKEDSSDSCLILEFIKQIENVYIAKSVMLSEDGISCTVDYVLDIIPVEEDKHEKDT